jgi:hypothetical protein
MPLGEDEDVEDEVCGGGGWVGAQFVVDGDAVGVG